jgi:hypothetical protein
MNLAFSKKFPVEKDLIGGKNTMFVEKILEGFNVHKLTEYVRWEYSVETLQNFGFIDMEYLENDPTPKIHTIRRSIGRWREGLRIHFEIYSRTPARTQFAPVILCKGTEHLLIKYDQGKKIPRVSVDGMILDFHEISELAVNDGFDSVDQFFAYFNEDFEGEIVQWTDKRYFDGIKLSRKICDAIAKGFGGRVILYEHPETSEEMAMIKTDREGEDQNEIPFLQQLGIKGWKGSKEPKDIDVKDPEVANVCQCGWPKNECPGNTKKGCSPRPANDSEIEKFMEGTKPVRDCDCWLNNKTCKCEK